MKKGFTLIELLIVISIIGILAVALLPNILSAPATARDAGRKTELNSVIASLEQYKAASQDYPVATGGLMPSTMSSYFKGGATPQGANSDGETVFTEIYSAGVVTEIAYCKLAANDEGYSYVVAIRMEQPQNGDHAMNDGPVCGTWVVGTTYTPQTLDGSYWYFMTQ